MLRDHPVGGTFATSLTPEGRNSPKPGGDDVFSHPPITPTRAAREDEVTREDNGSGDDMWSLYRLVTSHFLASVSCDCTFTR